MTEMASLALFDTAALSRVGTPVLIEHDMPWG
jgi:hypothetical protein